MATTRSPPGPSFLTGSVSSSMGNRLSVKVLAKKGWEPSAGGIAQMTYITSCSKFLCVVHVLSLSGFISISTASLMDRGSSSSITTYYVAL